MIETNRVPFVDLVTPHAELRAELVEVFASALDRAAFIGGPAVEAFENEFAAFCGVSHCVGVGSGTDAVRFALMAAGVGEGDIAITVPNTFIATAEAVSQTGARAVFVDVDERTYNLDPQKLEEYLESECTVDRYTGYLTDRRFGKRVAAVVPVHLYGQPADMDRILELAERYNLTVVEDACQGHGAEYFSRRENQWKRAGSMGRAAAFSFYPGKNLGACGEAGAVTTNDAELAQQIRALRDHGQMQKYYHQIEGFNGRLDAVQAGLLSVKLRRLSEWNEQRRECASRYQQLLGAEQELLNCPHEPSWAKAVYHLYVIRVGERDRLQKHLNEVGIGTGIHYPIPLHLQNAYRGLGYRKGDFAISERAASEILSLPMYPGLEPVQQERVAQETLKCLYEMAGSRAALAATERTMAAAGGSRY
jgi:dTDP-4-amino-4,6-dideoxygalactose transaminase